MQAIISAIFWDPSRICFKMPIWGYPITWYGLLMSLGFTAGYKIALIHLNLFFQRKEIGSEAIAKKLSEQLFTVIVFSMLIGARLGHVFFYGWNYYRHHLIDIFKIWEGGLASHGALIAIVIGGSLFIRNNKLLSFMIVSDLLMLPIAVAAVLIRCGNFINQEIIGTPTNLPWGIIFGHSTAGVTVPVHPVQLYEACNYLCCAILLRVLWNKTELGQGLLTGIFFVGIFGGRFCLEFFKLNTPDVMYNSWLHMGQLLSIPCILYGIIVLCVYSIRLKKKEVNCP